MVKNNANLSENTSSPSAKGNRVTAHDVAAKSGVSQVTVSRVFSGRLPVAEATRKKVEKAARELGYQPNLAARTMRTGKTGVIGIVAPSLRVPISVRKIEALERALAERGYQATVGFTGGRNDRSIKVLEDMAGRQVEGIAYLQSYPSWPIESAEVVLKKLDSMFMPCVLGDMANPSGSGKWPSVRVDRAGVMAEAAKHLAEIGREHTLFIGTMLSTSNHEKWRGFIEASKRFGLHVSGRAFDLGKWMDWNEESISQHSDQYPALDERILTNQVREEVGAAIKRDPKIDSIVTTNDHLAMAAIQALVSLGKRVPEDFAVIGHDDIPEAELYNPPLTTARQQYHQIGQLVAQMLADQVEGKDLKDRHKILATELIIRESTVGTNYTRNNNSQDRNTFTSTLTGVLS